jgi:signal transduction histidine kinase
MKPHFLLLLLAAGTAGGQVYVPQPGGPPAPGTPTDTVVTQQQKKPAASPFGQEIPMLDPSAETLTVGGVTIPLGDNRLLKARFEKYLSQPPESDEAAAEYRKNVAEILATISPFHKPAPNLYDAFQILPRAATYPADANICFNLAEAVYMAMLAKQDIAGLKKLNESIELEKKDIQRQADWDARHEKAPGVAVPAGGGGGAGGGSRQRGGGRTTGSNPGAGTESLKYADTLRRIAEIEVLKKANIVRTEAETIRTKAQYQVNMVQWFIQRRFEHVLMAARFYNQIWKDGDTTLRIDKGSDVAKLFSESMGVSPTVSSLDSLSNEAIREADKYIEAFNLMLTRKELHSASQRLMEAFAVGEFLAPVATLPLEKKLQVLAYTRDLNEVYGALQAHDFTKAKELADRLKATAKDFPSSKMDGAISGYSLASDLAIEEAKAHLLAKENDKAAAKIRDATEIWPTNPKLSEFRKLITDQSPLLTARNDFDRLLLEGNYREIAKRQYEFAPVIQGDATREDAFKQIITNLTKIETALGKAVEFSKVGQNFAAWEQLAELRKQFPDDPKLGRELELLAPKVAKFTFALDRAEQFENRTPKQTGTALAWYLKAREYYPQSDLADAGIKRMLDEIIVDDTGRTDATTAEKARNDLEGN